MQVEQTSNIRGCDNIETASENCYFSRTSNFEVKITQESSELQKAKKLRLKDHSLHKSNPALKPSIQNNTLQAKQLIEQQQVLIHDGYDSFADHLIVIDHVHDKVIAYVRLIDAYTAYKIGGYYTETQFNLNKLFAKQTFYLEMSRLVIDPEYQNIETATLIWSGITKHAQDKGVDAIIGSLSLPLNQGIMSYSLLRHLKKHHISAGHCRVQPYQLLPDPGSASDVCNNCDNPVIEYFFNQGVKLCGDAYWNKELNHAELFIHYEVNKAPIFPECIRMNEVELGLMCK